MQEHTIYAQLVDIPARTIRPVVLKTQEGKIATIRQADSKEEVRCKQYLLPGFVDAHIHIESSMLVPSAFARLAVRHGTVATVSDPHEIGNVLGVAGVDFMIRNGNSVPFKFFFGAPSCVPATPFETAGAAITPAQVRKLLERPEVKYLSEMMNYPGVLFQDAEVMEKIQIAKELGKPIDGHAPGLRGEDAKKYVAAGISTDHECFTYEEGHEKALLGMKILIREGSAAKNFDALINLLHDFPEQIMFCSDDKHPDDLLEGHINQLVARAVGRGFDLFDVLKAACINPVKHYKLEVGLLQEGDPADFILVQNLKDFHVSATYIGGQCVAEAGQSHIQDQEVLPINRFETSPKKAEDFLLRAEKRNIRVIEALDGQLVTQSVVLPAREVHGLVVSDTERDVLKFTVVNRYQDAPPAVAFIRNFGLKQGAIASCVGHDSHNILAVGTTDEDLARAVNLIIENQGGISAVGKGQEKVLPLPVAGIMSAASGEEVGRRYQELDHFAKTLGSTLHAPYMSLSFMALLVIPAYKLSDKGLFDGNAFAFTELFLD